MSYRKHMKGRDDPRTLYQIDRLHAWKHGRPFAPATVEISPTNACNQKCTYCYAWRDRPNMFLRDDILTGCMDQLADAGVGAVTIQGTGEPLLHKAVPKAIERAFARNIPIQLTTNGVLLTPALQEKILHQLFCIRVSVIDSDPSLYARHHGCDEQQWRMLIGNIEKAVSDRDKQDLTFGIWATVYLMEDNAEHLYDAVKFCKELGIDFVYVTEPQRTSFSPAGKKAYASTGAEFSGEKLDSMSAKISSLIDDDFFLKIKFHAKDEILSGRRNEEWKRGYCQGIKFYTLIGCDGRIYPCWRCWEDEKYSYGSLYEKTFQEIWNSDRRKQVEELVLASPPDGDECFVCTICLLNKVLNEAANPTKWMEFL